MKSNFLHRTRCVTSSSNIEDIYKIFVVLISLLLCLIMFDSTNFFRLLFCFITKDNFNICIIFSLNYKNNLCNYSK